MLTQSTNVEVFGPGRPVAARRAIHALEDLLSACDTFGGFPPVRLIGEVREARRIRGMYQEYGDAASAVERA